MNYHIIKILGSENFVVINETRDEDFQLSDSVGVIATATQDTFSLCQNGVPKKLKQPYF